MKCNLVWMICATFVFAAGSSYGNTLFLATDQTNLPCELHLVDDGVGVKSVYVMVIGLGLLRTRFAIEESADITMDYVAETHLLPGTSGDVHSGLTICLTSCALPPPTMTTMVRIDYMSYGTSPLCGKIKIISPPGYDGIDFVDCGGDYLQVTTWPLYVNSVYPECEQCDPVYFERSSIGLSCEPVPVEESTWGEIKALYD